jgi:hypothetical protein
VLCVANAAANSGANVETEPSISPSKPGCTYWSITRAARSRPPVHRRPQGFRGVNLLASGNGVQKRSCSVISLRLGKYVAVIARSKYLGCHRDDPNGDDKRQQRGVGRRIDQEIPAGRGANNQRDKHAK